MYHLKNRGFQGYPFSLLMRSVCQDINQTDIPFNPSRCFKFCILWDKSRKRYRGNPLFYKGYLGPFQLNHICRADRRRRNQERSPIVLDNRRKRSNSQGRRRYWLSFNLGDEGIRFIGWHSYFNVVNFKKHLQKKVSLLYQI